MNEDKRGTLSYFTLYIKIKSKWIMDLIIMIDQVHASFKCGANGEIFSWNRLFK